jgi:8-oxo-dGTP pyrophosphatase MutT (NUDIX family)
VSDRAGSLAERVAALLAGHAAQEHEAPGYRRAAVLLPIAEHPAGPRVILTRRSDGVPTHKGQVSLPGGGYREVDGDLRVTALREAEEEIGLRPQDVVVAGRLDDAVTTGSRFVVRPFVGVVPGGYGFAADRREIQEVIQLPVAWLLAEPFRAETWSRDEGPVEVLVQTYAGHVIWGLTARILQQFVERVAAPLWAPAGVTRSPGASPDP